MNIGKKTVRKAIAGILMTVMALGTLVVPAVPAEASELLIPITLQGTDLNSVESEIFSRINSAREAKGLSPLVRDRAMETAAETRSAEIAVNYSHTRPNGSSYESVGKLVCGENLSAGYESAADIVNAWLESSDHAANLLDGYYNAVGISVLATGNTVYAVTEFSTKDVDSASVSSTDTAVERAAKAPLSTARGYNFRICLEDDGNTEKSTTPAISVYLQNTGKSDCTATVSQDDFYWYSSGSVVVNTDNYTVSPKTTGSYTITAEQKDTMQTFQTEGHVYRNIESHTITEGDFTLNCSYTYTGKECKPTVKSANSEWVLGEHYTVTYTDNINVGTAKATVTGISGLEGSITLTFPIEKASQTISASADQTDLVVGETGKISASAKTSLSYKSSNESVLTVAADGTVTAKAAGTAKVTITAAEGQNYKQAVKSLTFTVSDAEKLDQTITVSSTNVSLQIGKTYALNASAKTTLSYKSSNTAVATVSSTGVISAVAAGSATITVTAKEENGYKSVSKTVTVTVTGLQSQSITVASTAVSLEAGKTYALNASAKTTLSYKSSNTAAATVSSTGVIRAVAAGSATITVTAKEENGYKSATKTVSVTVTAAEPSRYTLTAADVRFDSDGVLYSDAESVSVIAAGVVLEETADYTRTVTDNMDGTITVSVTGINDYTGTVSKTIRYSLEEPELGSAAADGNVVTVSWKAVDHAKGYRVYRSVDGGSWKKLADTAATRYRYEAEAGHVYKYTVRCLNDGVLVSSYDTAGVTVTVNTTAPVLKTAANTTGGVKVTWSASEGAASYRVFYKLADAGSWSKADDTAETSYTVSGLQSGKTYLFTVRCMNTQSKYVSSYNKTGLKILYLKSIAPTLSNTSSGINVKWTAVTGATGYRVYRKSQSDTKYTCLKTVTAASYADTAVNADNGICYTYAVRAISGSTLGAYTEKTLCRLTGVSLSGLSNTAAGTLTVKWEKNAKAGGYQIQYSTSSSFDSGNVSVKVSGASTLSKAISSLKKGTTYYVRVRAYKTVSGKTYYSAWSAKKYLKLTK